MEASLPDRYLNPFTDFGFKKLFGEEASKDLLIDFLNALLPQAGIITDLKYLSNEHLGRSAADRRAIFDIYCTNQAGEHLIVEMQKAKQNFFKDRSIYYATFPIREQAQIGDWNFELKAVYTVGILDFVFAEDRDSNEYFHHHVVLMDQERKTVFYDKLTFVYLEMPKFTKTEAELETQFDKWLYVLKNLPRLQRCPQRLQQKVFAKLFAMAEIATLSREEWMAYEDSLKIYRDLKNVMDSAVINAVTPLQAELKEKDQVIAEKDQVIIEKDQVIVEKEQALVEKQRIIAEAVRTLHQAGWEPGAIAVKLRLEPALVETILSTPLSEA